MRITSTQTRTAWASGDYTGANRAMMRATIHNLSMLLVPHGEETYASGVFGQLSIPLELPNVKSISWERDVDTDAASCTIVLWNTEPLPLGAIPERPEEFDLPGYYTYNRGKTVFGTTRWGHTTNGWADRIVPDRVIKTYEGYGFDPDLPPEEDPHMYLSGTWLIDDVDLTHDGLITISCRDFGALLIEQIMFPPVVPFKRYPLSYTRYHEVENPDIVVATTGWVKPFYETNSNIPYVGEGPVYGHNGVDAFDNSMDTFWMSIGNAYPNRPYSFEYIQGKFSGPTAVAAVKFRVWGGPYTAYVSVRTAGGWVGNQIVPYDPNHPTSAPNGSNIPFVASLQVGAEQEVHVPVGPIEGALSVRITLTNLYNSGLGTYKYRGGVRNIDVATQSSTTIDGGTHTEGNYGDYVEIVKKLLAYGGFYWPRSTLAARYAISDGSVVSSPAPSDDPILGIGRIWGDIEATGTNGPAPLGVEVWDKKPLMDGITYIKDIVGFNFYIDESGGAIFRSPNIWSVGNYLTSGGRTSTLIEIDERQTLMSLSVRLSSRNVRERVFVGNVAGRVGAVAQGFNPYPSGLRRVGGWTDQNFAEERECQIMADMITLRQMFTYRQDNVSIPGNPAIQIDDQVRVYERTTGESYVHYVKGISSEWDLEEGKWTYTLQTHWLGEEPFAKWAFDPAKLSQETRDYLEVLGKL